MIISQNWSRIGNFVRNFPLSKSPISQLHSSLIVHQPARNPQNYYAMSHDAYGSISDQQNNMYFGTEVVNRVSFLREDNEFITNAVFHPSTRFVFFDSSNPLVNKAADKKLVVLTNGDSTESSVERGLSLISGWNSILEEWSNDNKDQSPELRDDDKPTFLFLGLKDESVGLNLLKLKAEEMSSESPEISESYLDHQGRYQGIPFFAVDLTQSPKLRTIIRDHILQNSEIPEDELFYSVSRKHYLGFTHEEAALYSHGKMFLDWLFRNRFCPGCGSKVIPIHAGGKLKCTNEEKVTRFSKRLSKEVETYKCPTKSKQVSNVSFPRTDAVIITAIVNSEKTKILLSLSKRYAFTKMYSCTAGFMEPSETVEVATKREIWEETGVLCSKINIIMTQPWPFPANLMIGCIGEVEFNGTNEVIHLGHDKELADAQWFDINYIRKLIYEPQADEENPEGILIPSPESIAYLLIKMVVDQGSDTKL